MSSSLSRFPFKSLLRFANGPSIRALSIANGPSVRALSTSTETQFQKLDRIATDFIALNKLERYDYAILFRHKMGLNKLGPPDLGIHKYGKLLSGFEDFSGPATSGPDSGPAAAVEAQAAEKTAFAVKLEKFDAAAKIKVIKEVRGFTELGLKEAKELVEKTPVVVKKGLTKEEAEAIVEKLKGIGASAVLE